MRRISPLLRNQQGFTLSELLVVAAVLGLILAAVVLVQQRGQEAYLFGSHRVEVQQNNRAALELMVRELRSALSVTTKSGTDDLTFKDENGDSVRYQQSGTVLNRTYKGTTTTLIGGLPVQGLVFTYYKYDPIANTTSTPATVAEIQLIRIQLTTVTEDQVSTASPGNQRAIMESLVRLRNIL